MLPGKAWAMKGWQKETPEINEVLFEAHKADEALYDLLYKGLF